MNIVNWLPRYYVAQQFLTELGPNARVLDIACGEGDFTRWLSQRGAQAWGVDRDLSILRVAARNNAQSPVGIVAADIGQLPFADESLDWVISFDTLHFLPDDTPAPPEFARVLAKGGILLLSVPVRIANAGDLFWEQRALRRWLPKICYTQSRSAATGRGWFESLPTDLIYFRDYPLESILQKFSQFELVGYDYAVKRFSALAMDVAYGVRGFPRLGLKPYVYWLGTRLDAIFCRGPEHRGYTILVKLRKK